MQTQQPFGNPTNAKSPDELATRGVAAIARRNLLCGYTPDEVQAMDDKTAIATYTRFLDAESQARARAQTSPSVLDDCWRLGA